MPPFLHFRLWLRRAPAVERALVGVSGVVILGLLVTAVTAAAGGGAGSPVSVSSGAPPAGGAASGSGPAGRAPATGAAPTGSAPAGSTGAGSAASPGAGGGGGSGTGGSAVASGSGPVAGHATASSGSCGTLSATDKGVTPSQIHLGITVLDLEGSVGNSALGLPSPQYQEGEFRAAVAYVNKNGGVACRTLSPTFYPVNPTDPSGAYSVCLQIVQDAPFAVLDTAFAYIAADRGCLAQNHIPSFTGSVLLVSEVQKYSPYLFSYFGKWDQIMRNYVLGLRQLGWYAGARKIGILEEDCAPELNTEIAEDLAQVGIGGSEVTTFDLGCPSALPPPNAIEQAVLQFKTQGVTHVMDTYTSAENQFSRVAQQQDYHPKYSLPDGSQVAQFDGSNPGFQPDPANFANAVAITPSQYGADNSHLSESPGTVQCDVAMAAGGFPKTEQTQSGTGGVACDLVFMLAQAADRAAPLMRDQLMAGLDRLGSFDFPFPAGPASFSQPGQVTGGQYWRPDVYDAGCPCFKVSDAAWKPSF